MPFNYTKYFVNNYLKYNFGNINFFQKFRMGTYDLFSAVFLYSVFLIKGK